MDRNNKDTRNSLSMTEFAVSYDISNNDDREKFRKYLKSKGGVQLLKSCYAIKSDRTARALLHQFLKLKLFNKVGDDRLLVNAINAVDVAYFRAGKNSEKQSRIYVNDVLLTFIRDSR